MKWEKKRAREEGENDEVVLIKVKLMNAEEEMRDEISYFILQRLKKREG